MVLIRLNQIMLGWANYFKHAVAKDRFGKLDAFTWWRLIRMLRQRHRWSWGDVRRWLVMPSGRWRPISADGIELARMAAITVIALPLPGGQYPQPLGPREPRLRAAAVESPLRREGAPSNSALDQPFRGET